MLPDDLVGVANIRHMRAACGRQPLKLLSCHGQQKITHTETLTEINSRRTARVFTLPPTFRTSSYKKYFM